MPRIDNSKTSRTINVMMPLIVSIACVIGMIAGQRMASTGTGQYINKLESDQNIGIGQVEEVIRFIESKYVEEVDKERMIEDAVNTIMQDLDPHSLYIPKSKLDDVNNQLKGSYDGLGIETIFFNDTLVVLDVIKDGPSDKAGVRIFDKIIDVKGDNNISGEYDPQVLRSVLKGATGSNNKLVLKRHDTQEIDTLDVAIGNVMVRSADIAYMLDDSIGYIKIERFNSNIYKEFMESLEYLHESHQVKHLVIDVRQNPGGYLPETTKILSQLFPDKGKLLVYTEGRSDDRYEYNSSGKVFFQIDKIVVLIDEDSASGSEIIAGAIQDWDRGTIIGRRSYGKGLVQEQYGLSRGDALRLTVAKYYTPSGRSIQKPFKVEDLNNQSKELSDQADTIKYYTKIKHRPVYGGGGITPDIVIPKNPDINEDALGNVKQLVPEFAYTVLKNKLEEYPANYEAYVKSDLYDLSFVNQFEEYLIEEEIFDKKTLPSKYYNRVDHLIKAKIVSILYEKVNEGRFNNANDLFIEEAIRSISSKDIFAELSNE